MKYKIGKTAAIVLVFCLGVAGCTTRSGPENNTPSNDSIRTRSIKGAQNLKDSQNNHRGVSQKGNY